MRKHTFQKLILLFLLTLIPLFSVYSAQAAPGDFLFAVGSQYHFVPSRVAVDQAGNVYVADNGNSRIQVFTGAGVLVRTIGSFGSGEGELMFPYGVAVDGSGNVYVADTGNSRIQVFTGTGAFVRTIGNYGFGEGELQYPYGVAVDGSGNVYVTGSGTNAVVVFNPAGAFVRTIGEGQLQGPYDVALDKSGNVYVADNANCSILVFTGAGEFVRAIGSSGWNDGELQYPQSVAVDGSGNVYVADTENARIQIFDGSGAFVAKWDNYYTWPGYRYPVGVAVDGNGNVYVIDAYDSSVQTFKSNGEFVSRWASSGSGDGELRYPQGVAADGSGNIYVADTDNERIEVFTGEGAFLRNLSSWYPTGVALDLNGNVYVASLASSRIEIFSSAGEFLRAIESSSFYSMHPYGVALDESGNVYVADAYNNCILVYSGAGVFVRKIGSYGSGDGQFLLPRGLAVDAATGNVYVADPGNSRIQVFTVEGVFVRTIVNSAGDGQFNPVGVAVDGSGNLYVADAANNRVQVFTTEGMFLGQFGSTGDGDGQFRDPVGVATDATGSRVYVADHDNSRIQAFVGYGSPGPPRPVTAVSVTGTAGENGWYRSNVTVAFSATAPGVGIKEVHYQVDGGAFTVVAGSTASIEITSEGTHSLVYFSVSNAGTEGLPRTRELKLDKTGPTISITGINDGSSYLLNGVPTAAYSATDSVSGMFFDTHSLDGGGYTNPVGAYSYEVIARDYAGIWSSVTARYTVQYGYSGILQPINADGSSVFRQGSTIPVKFQLTDANAGFVSTAVASLYLAKMSNSVAGDELEAVSTAAATIGNLFRYDSKANQYIFFLGTKTLSKGTWQIRIQLDDGTSKYVTFSLN